MHEGNMELRHLQAFHHVADCLSFRRAAERLHVAQPALTRTIKDLEAEIGVTLFFRTTRSVNITPAGQVFREATVEVVKQLNTAVALTKNFKSRGKGTLTIGYNDFAIYGLLPEILKIFRTRYPAIQVKLLSMYSRDIRDQLLNGSIELGCLLPIGDSTSRRLSSVCIRRERLVAAVPARHALARARKIRLDALADDLFVTGSRALSPDYFNILDGFCQSHGFAMNVVQEADNSDGIVGLVSAGLGVALYVDCDWIYAARGVSVLQLESPPRTIDTHVSWLELGSNTPEEIIYFADVAQEVVASFGVEYGVKGRRQTGAAESS